MENCGLAGVFLNTFRLRFDFVLYREKKNLSYLRALLCISYNCLYVFLTGFHANQGLGQGWLPTLLLLRDYNIPSFFTMYRLVTLLLLWNIHLFHILYCG